VYQVGVEVRVEFACRLITRDCRLKSKYFHRTPVENIGRQKRPTERKGENDMTTKHHLTGHWVDEDDVVEPTHHHLVEHWVDEVDDDTSTEKNSLTTTAS
jgi:hypothetical protein